MPRRMRACVGVVRSEFQCSVGGLDSRLVFLWRNRPRSRVAGRICSGGPKSGAFDWSSPCITFHFLDPSDILSISSQFNSISGACPLKVFRTISERISCCEAFRSMRATWNSKNFERVKSYDRFESLLDDYSAIVARFPSQSSLRCVDLHPPLKSFRSIVSCRVVCAIVTLISQIVSFALVLMVATVEGFCELGGHQPHAREGLISWSMLSRRRVIRP